MIFSRNRNISFLTSVFVGCMLIVFSISVEGGNSTIKTTFFNRNDIVLYAEQFLIDEELKKAGYHFDCSGFVCEVYRHHGIILPRSSQEQFLAFSEPDSAIQAGDLVFFKIRKKAISHVGIYISDSTFIHSPGRNRYVTKEYLTAAYWKNSYAGYRSVAHNLQNNVLH